MKVSVLSRHLAAACGVFSVSAVAAPVTLDEIMVTATRGEAAMFEVPQAVSSVTSADITEKNYRTVPEALAHQPGVMVQKTAHGQGSPFIRGLTGKQVLVLVDGVRLNNATFRFGPNQYLATIDPGLVDRIEVVRGPSSVLYGSDALGGVINIITRKRQDFSADQDWEGALGLLYGSADDEKTGRITVEGNRSALGYWATAAYRDFNNMEGGGDIGEQLYTGYEEYHANAALSYRLDKDDRIDLTIQETRQNEVPRTDKFINDNEARYFDPQERTALALHWDMKTDTAWAQRIKGNVSMTRQKEGLRRQAFGDTKVRYQEDVIDTLGLVLQADTLVGERHLVSYGLEYYADEVDSMRVDVDGGVATAKNGNFPDGAEYFKTGLFIQDEILLADKTDLTVGLRYSHNSAEADLTALGFGPFDESYSDVTGSVRLSHLLTAETRVFASISQGFRAPNLDDLVVFKSTNEGVDVPSPNLESEKSLNYELGLKFNKSAWQGTLVAFWSDYTDLIDRGPGTYQGLSFIDENGNGIQDAGEEDAREKFNIGEAKIWGFEADGALDLSREWQLYGNLAWIRGENETDNEPVSRIPPMRALLGARWTPEGRDYWVEPFVELVDNQDRVSARDISDPRIPAAGTPGYGTFNVHAGWEHGPHALNVSLNNLGDKAYKVHGSGVYGPGREIKLGYTLRF